MTSHIITCIVPDAFVLTPTMLFKQMKKKQYFDMIARKQHQH